jgi:hypothetical protein
LIRNRQVIGSSPIVGSILFRSLRINSPKLAAHLLLQAIFASNRFIAFVGAGVELRGGAEG